MSTDTNRNHLYPPFAEKLHLVLADMDEYAKEHMPGYTWDMVEGFRSTERQQWLYNEGRTAPGKIVTYDDGVRHKSHHQSSCAADCAPKNEKGFTWDIADQHWRYYGHVVRSHGLEWGGGWSSFVDRPHCQIKPDDRPTYAAARLWQKRQGLR